MMCAAPLVDGRNARTLGETPVVQSEEPQGRAVYTPERFLAPRLGEHDANRACPARPCCHHNGQVRAAGPRRALRQRRARLGAGPLQRKQRRQPDFRDGAGGDKVERRRLEANPALCGHHVVCVCLRAGSVSRLAPSAHPC